MDDWNAALEAAAKVCEQCMQPGTVAAEVNGEIIAMGSIKQTSEAIAALIRTLKRPAVRQG